MSERIKAVNLTRICQMPSGKLVEDQKGQTVSDQSHKSETVSRKLATPGGKR